MILYQNKSRKQALIEIGNKKRFLREQKEKLYKKAQIWKWLFLISLKINIYLVLTTIYNVDYNTIISYFIK